MSKKDKAAGQAAEQQKIVTSYDRKQQRRQEQKEREAKEKRRNRMIGIAAAVIVIAFIASFPIRTYMATHKTFVEVGGQKITQVEFDYNYNILKNNYINQYGSYLTYFGLDTTKDLATQMYSDTMSWKDYFEEMAISSIKENVALMEQAKAAGFTYDTAEDYDNFVKNVKDAAKASEVSTKTYVRSSYGDYATLSRLAPFIRDSLYLSAFYEQVSKEKMPADDQIQTYYEENKASYDAVNYYQTIVTAQLPTEPTELADEGAAVTEDGSYTPSDAEVDKAMEDAKEEADAAVASVVAEENLREGAKQSAAAYVCRDWLFDEERKEGDTTVIEDSANNQYYVLSFVNRYRDETPTADVRVIITSDKDGQEILEEWKNNGATEDSFIELCKKYSEDQTAMNGGLYEGIVNNGSMDAAISAWIFAEEGRNAGDTTTISMEDGNHYTIYYVGENKPEWSVNIKSTLLSQTMTAYLEEITANVEVVDVKNNLNYLKVRAAEAEAEASAEAENTEAESTEAENTETEESASAAQ